MTQAMHIGEVAARTDLSIRSLRHWEEVGLLTPSGRTDGGFRLYTEDDVERILLVRRMKPLGFSLDEMKVALTHLEALRRRETTPTERDRALEQLAAVKDDASERRKKLVRQLDMADEFIGILERQTARP
ncbi:MAG: MerR family transcriptional regulator [Actinomycetales bacterium]|nr:MAG: MerR family transcriptional regulator [Actinomycetales bacterium]